MSNRKLVALVKKHFPKDRVGQAKVFCTHWLDNDYFVGWYKKGESLVQAYRVTYPANAPAGFVTVGQSRVFERQARQKRALTPQEKAKGRSEGYWQMSDEDQWAEDKRLGLLDWDGK